MAEGESVGTIAEARNAESPASSATVAAKRGTGINDGELRLVAAAMRNVVDIRDRRYRFKTFPACFIGSEACEALVASQLVGTLEEAVKLGNTLLDGGFLVHAQRDHTFKNEPLFYRFTEDEDHGNAAEESWSSVRKAQDSQDLGYDSAWEIRVQAESATSPQDPVYHGVSPLDEHNTALLDKVHPQQWVDPTPKPIYDLVVIGAGAGGLVSAAGAAGTGARVALIEANLLGGDCLNVGCVPSKSLLHAATMCHTLKNQEHLSALGISVGDIKVDFAKVMENLRQQRAHIADNDSATRFTRKLGVDVFFGYGRFMGKKVVRVNNHTLQFTKCIIATGGAPRLPDIPGMKAASVGPRPNVLTNETLFNLTSLPSRFGVIGTGPIGCEMAQAFQRLGSQVTLMGRSGRILKKEDQDAAECVRASMAMDGVTMLLNITEYMQVEDLDGKIKLTFKTAEGKVTTKEFDKLLVAAGRSPNVKGLNLELAEVKYCEEAGVQVNDKMLTSNGRIYAVGDVCTQEYQFTHASDFMARAVVRNALFLGREKFSALNIPAATYTSPEVAHTGCIARQLDKKGIAYQTFEKPLAENDRSILQLSTNGFVRVYCKRGTDEILGATIVGQNAGEMISEVSVAMAAKMGLGTLASVIHPYPTVSDAIRACGDLYNRTRVTPSVKSILRRIVAIQRSSPRRSRASVDMTDQTVQISQTATIEEEP
eukprot:m.112418 g.112418  ORF g.112418 m.112418 type:complete len:710 (-) comp13473_c0_seq5:419-2548(-)